MRLRTKPILTAIFLRWDTSNVVFMDKLFLNASVFNKPLAFWKTTKVLTMERMFEGASAFDRDVTFLDSRLVIPTWMECFTNANSFLAKFKCESLINGPPSSCMCSREFDCCVGQACELELDDMNLMDAVSECLLEDPIYGLCERFGSRTKAGNNARLGRWSSYEHAKCFCHERKFQR